MHHWQDFLLAICVFAFNIALVPSVLGKSKPELNTSLITAFFLGAGIIAYVSLGLWYTVAMQAVNMFLWVILGVQKSRQVRVKRRKR